MARFSALVLAACALALVAPSHQQYYYPYYPMYGQERLFLGGALIPNFLIRTTTTTSTVSTTATCTKSVAACQNADVPFPNGFNRRTLEEILADEEIVPSKTIGVESTAVSEAEASARQAYYAPGYYPYGPHGIDSSIIQSAGYYYPGAGYPVAGQARLFITRTSTITTTSTSTRTLTPQCSKAGFFTQCP